MNLTSGLRASHQAKTVRVASARKRTSQTLCGKRIGDFPLASPGRPGYMRRKRSRMVQPSWRRTAASQHLRHKCVKNRCVDQSRQPNDDTPRKRASPFQQELTFMGADGRWQYARPHTDDRWIATCSPLLMLLRRLKRAWLRHLHSKVRCENAGPRALSRRAFRRRLLSTVQPWKQNSGLTNATAHQQL